MHKRILPVLFAVTILLSCNKPAADSASNADSTALNDVLPSEDPTNDTAYNGNTDGDYFVPEGDSIQEEDNEDKFVSLHTSEVEIVGFSADGKYFVFTQFVPGDYGGGIGYVYLIDAAKNEWATKPAVLERADVDIEEDEIKEGIKKMRDSVLSKYNIKKGNVGKTFDLSSSSEVVVNSQRYTLDLQAADLKIELHLKGNGKDILLQKDKNVPKSRGSVRAYRLNKAVAFGDKIAVFVEYDGDIETGFENMRYYDRKYIAITAVVK